MAGVSETPACGLSAAPLWFTSPGWAICQGNETPLMITASGTAAMFVLTASLSMHRGSDSDNPLVLRGAVLVLRATGGPSSDVAVSRGRLAPSAEDG